MPAYVMIPQDDISGVWSSQMEGLDGLGRRLRRLRRKLNPISHIRALQRIDPLRRLGVMKKLNPLEHVKLLQKLDPLQRIKLIRQLDPMRRRAVLRHLNRLQPDQMLRRAERIYDRATTLHDRLSMPGIAGLDGIDGLDGLSMRKLKKWTKKHKKVLLTAAAVVGSIYGGPLLLKGAMAAGKFLAPAAKKIGGDLASRYVEQLTTGKSASAAPTAEEAAAAGAVGLPAESKNAMSLMETVSQGATGPVMPYGGRPSASIALAPDGGDPGSNADGGGDNGDKPGTLPKWVLPVGIGVGALLLLLILMKK